jgi:hypothetical protein
MDPMDILYVGYTASIGFIIGLAAGALLMFTALNKIWKSMDRISRILEDMDSA